MGWPARRRSTKLRAVPALTVKRAILGVLVVAFVAGTAWAYATGRVSAGSIEAWLESLGPIAPAMFVVAFVLGAFIGMPGMMFVIGGRLAFGAQAGFVLGYGAGLLACIAPFATARRLRDGRGGRSRRSEPWQPRNRHLRRALEMVESHPLRAVLLLRLVLWFNPPLSYALAMTRIPVRTYIAGCAIALAPVVAVAVLAIGWLT
jgi:uncharacterized membrane protein YdjX (TVP38/TMEM64 family)